MAPGVILVQSKTAPLLTPQNGQRQQQLNSSLLAELAITSVAEYQSLDKQLDRPYAAVYWTADVSSQLDDNIRRIFGGGQFEQPDAEFEVMTYEHWQTYEGDGVEQAKPGRAPMMAIVQFEPAAGTDDELDAWYRAEHLPLLGRVSGYRRSLRYKLSSIVAVAVPVASRREPVEIPRWLGLHEFEARPPREEVRRISETEWARKVEGAARQIQIREYALAG